MNLSHVLNEIKKKQLKKDVPNLMLGDQVRVGVLIQEGNKQRTQIYQGVLIAQHRNAANSSITVRRVFQGVGVDRIFLIHSPVIQNIVVLRHAKVRRAKLYYLRHLQGKASRLRERFIKNL